MLNDKHELVTRFLNREIIPDDYRFIVPATSAEVETTERKIGTRLPDFLRVIYSNVCNGAVGELDQLLGCANGAQDGSGDDLGECYRKKFSLGNWPEPMVPFWHLGRGVLFCFNRNDPGANVILFDPKFTSVSERSGEFCVNYEGSFFQHRRGLRSLFEFWLHGKSLWAEMYLENSPPGFGSWSG